MPPSRPIPPVKPLKTERTHEENQERAYIAASRRSDRSLEARVESARRASEIHKRRTGRSLRVTEQDVINEEMYEEEDDDLPLQYRRLTAHLQTGSAEFNRRLAAYLTNQVAMRSAVEQMVQNSYGQYPNMQGFQQQSPGMFPSPMLPGQGTVGSPTGSYRHAPYPSPHSANFRQHQFSRGYSMASLPQGVSPMTSPGITGAPTYDMQRRMSTPAPTAVHTDMSPVDAMQQPHSATAATFPTYAANSSFPLTMSLPPESQQMLAHAPGFDPNDPSLAMLMTGSDLYASNPYYPWPNMEMGGIKGMPVHPSNYSGMSATLAPSAIDMTTLTGENRPMAATTDNTSTIPNNATSNTPPDTSSRESSQQAPPTAGLNFGFNQENKGLEFGGAPSIGMSRAGSFQNVATPQAVMDSGQMTPLGEGFWDNFVMDGSWDEVNAASEGSMGTGDGGGS